MKTLNEAIDAAKKVVADDKADNEALETAAKELNDKIMPIGAKMYEQVQKDANPTEEDKPEGPSSDDKKSDKPVEGEVVDDKDEKS